MSNSDQASVQRLEEAPSILNRAAIQLARTEAEGEIDLLHHLPDRLTRLVILASLQGFGLEGGWKNP